jgi:hypothetical protein
MGDALELIGGLVTEEGQTWAEHAAAFQHRDAAAVCADPGSAPRRHFIVRPRGASKTTDAAGVGLARLVEEAPRRSRSYIYAVDADQAGEVLDALGGFVATTPELAGAVEIGARTATVKATGASLTVEASDAASAWSKRPWLVIVDEFTSGAAARTHGHPLQATTVASRFAPHIVPGPVLLNMWPRGGATNAARSRAGLPGRRSGATGELGDEPTGEVLATVPALPAGTAGQRPMCGLLTACPGVGSPIMGATRPGGGPASTTCTTP